MRGQLRLYPANFLQTGGNMSPIGALAQGSNANSEARTGLAFCLAVTANTPIWVRRRPDLPSKIR